MSFRAPDKKYAHDDYVDSLLLAVWAAESACTVAPVSYSSNYLREAFRHTPRHTKFGGIRALETAVPRTRRVIAFKRGERMKNDLKNDTLQKT